MQLLSYAIHYTSEQKGHFDATSESGYSVFLYNPGNPNSSCVLNNLLHNSDLEIALYISLAMLEIASVFIVPLLMVNMYKRFKKKMEDTKTSRMPFLVWAFILIASLLVVIMYISDGYAVLVLFQYSQYLTDCLIASLSIFPIVDVVATFLVILYRFNFLVQGRSDFFINCNQICCVGCRNYSYHHVINHERDGNAADDEENQRQSCRLNHLNRYPFHYRCLTVVKVLFHFFSIWIVTLFTQLALFNSIFLTLAVVAAPVETGSLSLLCVASLFCLITFFAIILKIFFKLFEKPLKDDPENRRQKQYYIKIILCHYLYGFFLFGVVFISLAAGIIAFVVFVILYSIKVQEYRNSHGVLVFLGALLPSVLAVSTGIFLQKIFRCLENKEKPPQNYNQIRDPHIRSCRVQNEDNNSSQDENVVTVIVVEVKMEAILTIIVNNEMEAILMIPVTMTEIDIQKHP